MTDADDLILLANTPAEIDFLLHSFEQAAGDIGLYRNADKSDLESEGVISTISGKFPKLINEFTFFKQQYCYILTLNRAINQEMHLYK